ncbi:hypothetical protein MalM25_37210 [Planctomycetes bacterium MalM25]|nr:hypothetical protein MalM25_37210 [Planctomycetes bacterium MalM25]
MRRPRLTNLLLAVPLLALVAAADAADCVRPGDRLVLVSTRPVGCTTDAERLAEGVFAAERAEGRWVATPLGEALGSLDPAQPIVFYVHGNQIETAAARRRGRHVYQRLIRCGDDRPVQFVIFSWCSGKVPGLVKDYRVKAARTRPVAWQLAWVLDRLPSGSRVGLLGYSYGARVSSGASHLLAGGSLSGLAYPGCSACGVSSMRAVFLAGAYDACWNATRSYHGRALDKIDTLLVTLNPRDPAMRYFRFVSKHSNPTALGSFGPRGLNAEQAARVRLMPVASAVGKSHDLYDYLGAPGLMSSAWRRLTFADGETAAPREPTLASAG